MRCAIAAAPLGCCAIANAAAAPLLLLQHLYNYVYVHESAPDDFEIVKNFPRTVIPCQPAPEHDLGGATATPTFLDVGLANAELLFVHDNEA